MCSPEGSLKVTNKSNHNAELVLFISTLAEFVAIHSFARLDRGKMLIYLGYDCFLGYKFN